MPVRGPSAVTISSQSPTIPLDATEPCRLRVVLLLDVHDGHEQNFLAAYEQIRGKLDIAVADIGEPELKNIARPVRAYRVQL